MARLLLILSFTALALCQPWYNGPVVENYLRGPQAYGVAPFGWEAPVNVVREAPAVRWEAPREVIVEAPRIINPLGYDNYGNANVEHPYAHIDGVNGTAYAIESEVTHKVATTAPRVAPRAVEYVAPRAEYVAQAPYYAPQYAQPQYVRAYP